MSRIGNTPILISSGVTVNIAGQTIFVEGPKGKLELTLRPEIKVAMVDNQLILKRSSETKMSKSLHGLYRSMIANMVVGVTQGWIKNLEMVGVGYRASGGGDILTMSIGFSHPVEIKAPEGVEFTIADNTKLTVTGIDKILVGQVAANIRAVKPPEVYKGKGIRYVGEFVRRKPGKAGKAIVGAK